VSLKEGKTLDRVDSLDTIFKTLPENGLKTLPGVGLAEKLEQLKTWLLQNKDKDGQVDASALTSKIKELNLNVQQTVQILKDEYWIREVPDVGKWGVK